MFSLILPFHSDVTVLRRTLEYLHPRYQDQKIGQILICHNGDPLDDQARQQLLAGLWDDVEYLHTDTPGLGAGYRLGLTLAKEPYTVLSASDLPFGFSDIESFFGACRPTSLPELAIGSKAHPESILKNVPFKRRLSSSIFFLFRKLLLGKSTPADSQGTIIVCTELGKSLIRDVLADDYLFAIELLTLAISRGIPILDLPIVYDNQKDPSSVSLGSDGIAMLRGLITLSKRNHSQRIQ